MPTFSELDDVSEFTAKPYDQKLDEPLIWFARFQRFLLAGYGRTLSDVYRHEIIENNTRGRHGPSRALESRQIDLPGNWKESVKRWQWWERAREWDKEQAQIEREKLETDRQERRRIVLDQ